jgi:hypothetical protein
MNIKLKMTFIIITTLVIGIFIGALLNRIHTQNRIKDILYRRNPGPFVASFEKIIEPDAAQRKLVRDILDRHAKRISEIRMNSSKELKSSFESMMAELNSVLTPEQKKRLEKRKFPGFPPFSRPRPFPMPLPRRIDVGQQLSVLKEKLGLSEDQASQIKQILEEARDEFQTMREKELNSRERWQFIREIEEKKDGAIEKILTKDQKKLYEQIKKERPGRPIEEMHKRRGILKEKGFAGF